MDHISRRLLLRWAGMAMAGAATGVNVPLKVQAQAKAKPLGTARNAIFIQLTGAMSQMDCWDLKETKWTPKDLDPVKVWGDLYLSKTLFGRLITSKQMQNISFVRSMRSEEHTSELQSRVDLVCRLLLEKKKK